jgi:hemoglobin-like flavoprotein
MNGTEIERSFEIAAERAGDITPLVYQRLFAQHPEMEALFVRDTTGAVRGEMLAAAINTRRTSSAPRS